MQFHIRGRLSGSSAEETDIIDSQMHNISLPGELDNLAVNTEPLDLDEPDRKPFLLGLFRAHARGLLPISNCPALDQRANRLLPQLTSVLSTLQVHLVCLPSHYTNGFCL